jgi:hypothetical protein
MSVVHRNFGEIITQEKNVAGFPRFSLWYYSCLVSDGISEKINP